MLGNPLPVRLWLYDVLYLNLHLLKLPRGLKCLYIYISDFIDCRQRA